MIMADVQNTKILEMVMVPFFLPSFGYGLRQTPFSGRVVLLGLYYDQNTVQIAFEISELKTARALKAKIRE